MRLCELGGISVFLESSRRVLEDAIAPLLGSGGVLEIF